MTSLFKKQFLLYTSTFIIIFILLGIGLTQAFTSLFMEQKKATLISQGEKITQAFQDAYHFTGIYNFEKVKSEISVLNTYLDSSFVFIDKNYTIIMASSDINSGWVGQKLQNKFVKTAIDGKIISDNGNFYGLFAHNVLTVGYPVKIDSYNIGAIFMCTTTESIEMALDNAYRLIVIFICAAILIGFIVITIFSRNFTLPLYKMTEAAKTIANGNFSHRIKINSKDEIGELAKSFNIMAESLERQEEVRTQFLSNISHDLRSPLTSIKGFLNAMLDGTIPPENHNKYIKIVCDESERLIKLATSVLEANSQSLNNVSLHLSDFDVNALIKKVALSFSGTAAKKEIYIKVHFDNETAIVIADIDKIERVIYNLLDNALKFTPKNGEINIYTESLSDKIKITVTDNGQGISEEDKKRIFERFFKADSSRGIDKMGVGLGLSICRNFIKEHGSQIEVQSELGKGTTFSFTLSSGEL